MDYGDGRLNGEYQFNTRYRKGQMCATMNGALSWCGGNFAPTTQGPTPTPPPTAPPQSPTPLPTAPTPTPPSAGSCSYGLEACRIAAQRLNLGVRGFAFYSFEGRYTETGCYAHRSGFWKGYAWYGLRGDGSEVQGESDLSVVSGDKYRIEGTYNCKAPTPTPTPAPTSAPAPPPSGCNDLNQDCPTYESYGFCAGQYADWMAANCKKSCNLCGAAPCADDYTDCEAWGSYGYCVAGQYVSWMHQYCKRTCDTCERGGRSHEPMIAPEGAPSLPPKVAPGDDDQLLSGSWPSGPCLSSVAILLAFRFMLWH